MINREAIKAVTALGHVVVEFEIPDGWCYVVAHKFDPAGKTAIDETEYHTLVGIDITDFLDKRSNTFAQIDFQRSLEDFLASPNTSVIAIEISNKVRWYKWKSVR